MLWGVLGTERELRELGMQRVGLSLELCPLKQGGRLLYSMSTFHWMQLPQENGLMLRKATLPLSRATHRERLHCEPTADNMMGDG